MFIFSVFMYNSHFFLSLSLQANPRLHIDDVIVRRLLYNLKNEPPTESWFDEAKSAVICKIEVNIWSALIYVFNLLFILNLYCMYLQKDDRFMPSFRKSLGYIRLLAELDLLKDASKSDDEDVRSLDEQSTNDSSGLLSFPVDEKEKVRIDNDNFSSVSANNDESTYTLTASICQKGSSINYFEKCNYH